MKYMHKGNLQGMIKAWGEKSSKIIIDTVGKIYIENQGTVSKYCDSEIVFHTKELEIGILGQNLYLEFIEGDCVQVSGQVYNVSLKEL